GPLTPDGRRGSAVSLLTIRFALPPAAEYSLRSFRASPREFPASGGEFWNWPPAIPEFACLRHERRRAGMCASGTRLKVLF
ncbi:hypothetical protein, partial [Streptomyces sp. NPDC055753]